MINKQHTNHTHIHTQPSLSFLKKIIFKQKK